MQNLIKQVNSKVNGLVWSLLSTGIILLILSVLVVWTDFILRLVFGMFVLVLSYAFLYGAYKVWSIKRDIENHFKF